MFKRRRHQGLRQGHWNASTIIPPSSLVTYHYGIGRHCGVNTTTSLVVVCLALVYWVVSHSLSSVVIRYYRLYHGHTTISLDNSLLHTYHH